MKGENDGTDGVTFVDPKSICRSLVRTEKSDILSSSKLTPTQENNSSEGLFRRR